MSPESLVVFILILGVLVAFHEFGHLIAAKLSGMKVEEFAFGFGPRLLNLGKRCETEYTIHAVPLGGFVKITGMEPGEEDIPDGFQAQSAWKRAVVLFAGPLFSFILGAGVLLFVGVYWGFQDFSQPQPIVGTVQPQTEAARIDLRAGDRVLEINGVKITKGIQMTDIIHSRPGQEVRVVVDRDGKRIPLKTARPRWLVEYLGADWSFMKGPQATVEGVAESSAAAKAGIQQEDKLVAINGRQIRSGAEMVDAIKSAGAGKVSFTLDRNGQEVSVTAPAGGVQWVRFAGVRWLFPGGIAVADAGKKPEAGVNTNDIISSINGEKITGGADMLKAIQSAGGTPLKLVLKRETADKTITVRPVIASTKSVESGSYTAIGLLGFQPAPKLVKTGFSKSIQQGFTIVGKMVELLAKTLTSKRIGSEVGGPIMIAKVTQQSVALGPYWVLIELGSLSLSLAVINLIPIPAVFDGGHLILLGIESIRKKRWTRSQMAMMQVAGLALVAALFIMIFVSDITKIVSGQVPQ